MDFPIGVDTVEECKELLREKTRPYDIPWIDFVPYKTFSEGILLKIEGDMIILYCNRPSYVTYPREAFFGHIDNTNGKIVIRGEIDFAPRTKLRNRITFIGMFLMTGIRAWFIAAMAVVVGFFMIFLSLNNEEHRANRQAIIDLLNSLDHIEP